MAQRYSYLCGQELLDRLLATLPAMPDKKILFQGFSDTFVLKCRELMKVQLNA